MNTPQFKMSLKEEFMIGRRKNLTTKELPHHNEKSSGSLPTATFHHPKKDYFRKNRARSIPNQRSIHESFSGGNVQSLALSHTNTSNQSPSHSAARKRIISQPSTFTKLHATSKQFLRKKSPTSKPTNRDGKIRNIAKEGHLKLLPSLFSKQKRKNVELFVCLSCNNKLYGEENFNNHTSKHHNTTNHYLQERASIFKRNGSVLSLLDEKTFENLPNSLQKLKLVTHSRTNLDAFLMEEKRQSSLLSYDNAMKLLEQKEWKKALQVLKMLAKQLDCSAIVQIGKLFETGVCVLRDEKMAYKYYLQAALEGDKNMDRKLIEVVVRFLDYTASENDSNKIPDLIPALEQLISQKQSPDYFYWLAKFYDYLDSILYSKLIELNYRKAAALGNAPAMFEFAEYLLRIRNNEEQCKEAVQFYKNAIVHSFPLAAYKLSILVRLGLGAPASQEESDNLLSYAQSSGVQILELQKIDATLNEELRNFVKQDFEFKELLEEMTLLECDNESF